MNLKLEKIKVEDYKEFLEIYEPFFEFHRSNADWKFKRPEGDIFGFDHFKETISSEKHFFFFIKDGAEVIGFTLSEMREDPKIPLFHEREFLFVDDLLVKDSHRSKGVGSWVLSELESIAKENGIYDIELKVRSFNDRAISFYEREGFETITQNMRKTLK